MSVLLSRWTTTLVGTALLAALVWVFGPLWPPLEDVLPRALVIQTMLVVWAVANALLDWRRRSRGSALMAGLGATGAEAEAVGETLTKALGLLRKSGQRGSLTELPWYAIIGPPGAGKTTALLNAGLRFTLSEQLGRASVAGVGGTRMCEWWFTEGAVLIDTAGRYTTQDSDKSVDRAGWDAFLGLLKRTRPRQPLNGVIVAIALPDVVQASAAELDAHAAAIAARITELERRFGMKMPVYALFTKADLIAGFSEFFDDLDAAGRDQVWGETYPLTAGPDLAETFGAGFRGLVGRLGAKMLARLQAEHRPERRGAIAGFPTQVASLEKPLARFVANAFAGGTMLRGVYFASGTQEGTPLDRLTGAMARAFGIDQTRAVALRPEAGRSYFLGRLLRDVIFDEAMLVREPPGAARRRQVVRAAGFAIILLAVCGAIGALALSDRTAERQIADVASSLDQYEQVARTAAIDPVSDGDLRPLVALLDRAAALPDAIPAQPVGFGMEQNAKLDAGARAVYRDGLIYGLLPRLVWRLETRMRGDLTRPDPLYEATRIYLMLGGAGPLNVPQVKAWMARDWALAYPDDAATTAALDRHLDRLLAEPLPSLTLDGQLVTAARASFSRVPLAERVFGSIRSSPAATALPPWRPADVLGLAGVTVFARASGRPMTDGIPGLYTADGYRTVLLPSIGAATKQVASETWVIGRQTDYAQGELADLQRAVAALYVADFDARWDAMLADLVIAPMPSLPQAAQALYIVASPESPMRALVRSLAAQLKLPDAGSSKYANLIALTAGDGAGLERSLRLVADIQQQLAKIAALPVGTAIPPGGDDIGTALQTDAARQPDPLGRWMSGIAVTAQALRTGNVRRQTVLAYNAAGGPAQACQAALSGHSPFGANGSPLPLDTFAQVFGPGGALDGFFNAQLKPFVDVSTKPWKPQAANGATPPVSPAELAQFQRAAAIRDAFFPAGQATPSVTFEIAPSPQAKPATLAVAGTVIESGKGPPQTAQITWPAADETATLTIGGAPASLTETGPWALFRLFGHGKLLAPNKAGRQELAFTIGPASVSYLLHLTAQPNAFSPGLLSDFRCPAVQ